MTKKVVLRVFRLPALLFLLCLVGLAVFYLAGPTVLERIIIGRLQSRGLVDPDLKVQSVTHKGLYLTRVSVQKPWIQADSIMVGFSIGGLLQGRVDEILVSGLKYRISIDGSSVDLGLPETHAGPGRARAFPVRDISVESSSLILSLQDKNYLIPFSVQADLEDEHKFSFSAWSHLLGQPLSIEGYTYVNTLETSIQARAAWSEFLEPGRAFYRQTQPFWDNSDPVKAGLSLRWETDSQGRWQARVDMRCQVSDLHLQAPGFELGLKKGSFSAKAGFDDRLVFDRLEADLSLSSLSINENRVDRLTLAVREQASALEFFAGLEHPVSAFLDVRGTQSSINEFLKNSQGYKADFEWKAGLDLGPELFDLLSPVEIETGSSVTVNAHGQLKGEYLPDAAQPENSWFLQVSAEQARTGPVSFHLPDLALQVSDLDLNLPFLIEARPGRTGAKIMPGSRISLKETVLKQQSARYQVEGLEFIGQGKKPFAEFEVLEDGIKSFSLHTRLNSGFEVISQNADVSGRDLLFSAKLQEDEQGVFNADISMQPDIALVRLKQTGVEIEDVSLDVPFVLGNARPGQGKFSTGRISYDGMHFPGISGQIIVENYQVKSRGSWPFLPGADLELAVDMLVDPGKDITGKIKAHTNWFDIPEKELRDVIVSMPEDMSITGSARAELALDVDAGSLRPQALIEIRDAGMLNPDMDMEIAGISGSMFIDDFFPLTTPGRQRMEIQKLRIGRLELIDGFATFRLESPERIFVEKTRWNLPEGGFIAAHAARIDLQDSNADFEVFFEDIDLVRLVSRISQEKIAGSGRVYGRVPLLYKQDKVTIGQGYLYSVPGTGRLRIKDEEWLDILLLYVRQAMKDHPYLSTVSERLELALRDFEYDFLSVNLEPGPDDTSARIELRGKGVRGDPPQEVGSLVINVNDLQEIVNRVLHFQLTRDESVKKALDDLLDFEK